MLNKDQLFMLVHTAKRSVPRRWHFATWTDFGREPNPICGNGVLREAVVETVRVGSKPKGYPICQKCLKRASRFAGNVSEKSADTGSLLSTLMTEALFAGLE